MKHCDRCFKNTNITIMSKFNRDILCLHCKDDETHAPGYKEAADAEAHAVAQGEYNFPGVGLSREAGKYLAERRKERAA